MLVECGDDVFEVGAGGEAEGFAVFYDGVEHGIIFACFFASEEEPVFRPEFRRANRIFNKVIINVQFPIFQIAHEAVPLAEGIGDGCPNAAFWAMFGLLMNEGFVDFGNDGCGVLLSYSPSFIRWGVGFFKVFFNFVEGLDVADELSPPIAGV